MLNLNISTTMQEIKLNFVNRNQNHIWYQTIPLKIINTKIITVLLKIVRNTIQIAHLNSKDKICFS